MRKNSQRIKKITLMALFTSLTLLLAAVERFIPPIVPEIPGIRMGLPNIIIITIIYRFGLEDAIIVSLARMLIATMVFGDVQRLLYSFVGAALSLAVMGILKKIDFLSIVGVSVAGAIMHNLGQTLVAIWLWKTPQLGYYMILLTVAGTVSGIFIGLCGALLHKRLKKIKM